MMHPREDIQLAKVKRQESPLLSFCVPNMDLISFLVNSIIS